MLCIGYVIEREGYEHCDLYGIQLFASSKLKSIDMAVMSPPERYRLMQFLQYWIRWYKLCRQEIEEIGVRCGADNDNATTLYYPAMKRSLESYLNKQVFTTSQFYNSLAGAEMTVSTPPMSLKVSGSLNSPLASPTSTPGNSLKSKSLRTGSKRGLDFSTMSAFSVDAAKKAQLVKNVSEGSALSNALSAGGSFQLRDLAPYKHHANIPRVLLLLSHALVEQEGYKLEGIFRKSGASDEQHALASTSLDVTRLIAS